jgi:hypothetical protein
MPLGAGLAPQSSQGIYYTIIIWIQICYTLFIYELAGTPHLNSVGAMGFNLPNTSTAGVHLFQLYWFVFTIYIYIKPHLTAGGGGRIQTLSSSSIDSGNYLQIQNVVLITFIKTPCIFFLGYILIIA